MILSSNKLRTVDEMTDRFLGLPRLLAECYVHNAVFFLELRKFRDRIAHQGAGVEIIFDGDSDFFISETRVPFTNMNIWRELERLPNGLVPLTPALGYVIYRTLETCETFSQAIERVFQLPTPLVPDFHIYLRGYFNDELARVLKDVHQRLMPQAQT
jgi:hypothetical protein